MFGDEEATQNDSSSMTSSFYAENTTAMYYGSVTEYYDDQINVYDVTTESYGYYCVDGYEDLQSFYSDNIRAVFSFCTGIIGLPTILLLLAVTLTTPYRRHSYTLYLASMCVYDFLFVLACFVDSILELFFDKYLRSVLIWEFPCRLYEYIWYTSVTISIWLNVALAVDRYVIIAFPLKKNRLCNRRNGWFVCGGLFFLVHGIGVVYLIYGGVADLQGDRYCTGDDILHDIDLYLTDLGGLVPAILLIIIFSTLSVVRLIILKEKRKKMTSQPIIAKDRTSHATVALVTISFCTFITQIPCVANEVLRTYAHNNDIDLEERLWDGSMPAYEKSVNVFEGLNIINNIQNFFILFALNKPFRQDVASLFGYCKSGRSTNSSLRSSSSSRPSFSSRSSSSSSRPSSSSRLSSSSRSKSLSRLSSSPRSKSFSRLSSSSRLTSSPRPSSFSRQSSSSRPTFSSIPPPSRLTSSSRSYFFPTKPSEVQFIARFKGKEESTGRHYVS